MRNKIEYDILDGRLGASAGFPSGKIAVIGVSGIVPQGIIFLSDFSKVFEIFGDGPLRDFLQGAFAFKKKPTVYAKALTGSTAGTVSAVTSVKTGVGDITVAGDPRNEYDIQIMIDVEGGLNEAVFHYVIDGKESKKITVPNTPGTYAIPNTGLTLTFVPGTPEPEEESYEAGDVYFFSTTAPTATNADILEAVNELLIQKKDFSILAIAGKSDKALWTALNTLLLTEEGKNNFKMAVCEARYLGSTETIDDYVTALCGSEKPDSSLTRVQIVALHCEINDVDGQVDVRSPAGHYCGHLAAVCSVQERPGKVKLGSITGLNKIYPLDEVNDAHLSSLDDAGYVTPVTYNGKSGIFFSRGRMMTELTSDFKNVPERRVLDKALTLVYEKQVEFLNDDVNVNKKDGSPEGLEYFKAYSTMPLKDMIRDGEISNYELTIPEGQNILTTETLEFELGVTPKGYLGIIKGTIYFVNPALEVS
ncbi:MAG: DUF2586 family protein [Spirochaetes bacterium]|nr:DUF2586 family protein [Spirochaetota bacterium]